MARLKSLKDLEALLLYLSLGSTLPMVTLSFSMKDTSKRPVNSAGSGFTYFSSFLDSSYHTRYIVRIIGLNPVFSGFLASA
jgi:hypothetical protein